MSDLFDPRMLISITFAGFQQLVEELAPPNVANVTSHDLRKIFRGEAPHCLHGLGKFHPREKYPEFYKNRRPDVAISYPWDMCLRTEVPMFFRRAAELFSTDFGAPFEDVTFFFDIFFIDQNSSDIAKSLIVCHAFYRMCRFHFVFLAKRALCRGWILFEVGFRLLANTFEFRIDNLLEHLTCADPTCTQMFKSSITFEDVSIRDISGRYLPRNLFCEGISNLEGGLLELFGRASFGRMKTCVVDDKCEIQKCLLYMHGSPAHFSDIIQHLAWAVFMEHPRSSSNPLDQLQVQLHSFRHKAAKEGELLQFAPIPLNKWKADGSSYGRKVDMSALGLTLLALGSASTVQGPMWNRDKPEVQARMTEMVRLAAARWPWLEQVQVRLLAYDPSLRLTAAQLVRWLNQSQGRLLSGQAGKPFQDVVLDPTAGQEEPEQAQPPAAAAPLTVVEELSAALPGALGLKSAAGTPQACPRLPSPTGLFDEAVRLVGKDEVGARRLFQQAAKSGHGDAQNYVGNYYAQSRLCLMYEDGRGQNQDFAEAVKWFRLSAEQGHAAGQCNFSFMYYYGHGVEQDYDEAVKWFRLSAEQGHAEGQYNLGDIYVKGCCVKQDYDEAVRWYRLSAEQGNEWGQCSLGDMYRYGHGVKKDISIARVWYQKSADQKNQTAKHNLKYLCV